MSLPIADENVVDLLLLGVDDKDPTLRTLGLEMYRWFVMDNKLKVLHEHFPWKENEEEAPLFKDVMEIVNQRWNNLTEKERKKYRIVAEYNLRHQHEGTQDK